MRIQEPSFFSQIKREANQRWEQLEKDPDLAGPWHQLFKQIQSPRHVISELLQNADDVGATAASIKVIENVFHFSHNGKDFDEENLRSLCRFGFSNKKTLQTIGFRGIGFKSTFSLGPYVEVYTPSLSFAFDKKRFTEPIWIEEHKFFQNGLTSIIVKIETEEVQKFIMNDIQRWGDNPTPLLFFNNIKLLSFGDLSILKEMISKGPIENSKWYQLKSKTSQKVLLVSSDNEILPEDVVKEIKEERQDLTQDIPPCKIDLVFGLNDQRLFEVLPTNILLRLPFSVNGPFIQVPSRSDIKDPISSPMNTWLLKRAGELAGNTFISWLSNEQLEIKDKAKSYSIFPECKDYSDRSTNELSEKIIVEGFFQSLEERPVLLTTEGKLETKANCLNIDKEILEIWDEDQVINLFGENKTSIISKEVEKKTRDVLFSWDKIDQFYVSSIFNRLTRTPFPQNPGVVQTRALWDYVSLHLDQWNRRYDGIKELCIVPVKGKMVLYPSNQVNVLSAKEKQLTDEEYIFLEDHLIVIDPDWLKFIQSIRQEVNTNKEKSKNKDQAVLQLFLNLNLTQGITIESVIKQVSDSIFSTATPEEKGVRLAYIACRLGVTVPDGFKYKNIAGNWKEINFGILIPDDVILEILYPQDIFNEHTLSNEYKKNLHQDLLPHWLEWIKSEKSKLRKFLLPEEKTNYLKKQQDIENFIKRRNGTPPFYYDPRANGYRVIDHDFSYELWSYWSQLIESESNIWTYLVYQIGVDWDDKWEERSTASISDEIRRSYRGISHGKLAAEWLYKLKHKKCIPDLHSNPRKPIELLRNTPETALFLRIESFVHKDYDQPEFYKLLDLLGVRNKATDPSKIIDRIQSLSTTHLNNQLIQEISNYYDAINQIVLRMNTDQIEQIKYTFLNNELILSNDLTWHKSTDIYQFNPDKIPGLPSINDVCTSLNLWKTIGVSERPKIEDAIDWLNNIKKNTDLAGSDLNRCKSICKMYPFKIWTECKTWLNLNDQWVSVEELQWGVKDFNSQKNFFDKVLASTADFTFLENPTEIIHFAKIDWLENVLKYRIQNQQVSRCPPNPEWIKRISENLLKIKEVNKAISSNTQQINFENIYKNAKRLMETRVFYVNCLSASPMINGQVVGFPISKRALWHGEYLYILDDRKNHHREITSEISVGFSDVLVQDTLKDCIGRDNNWIDEYFSTYFILGEPNSDRELIDEEEPDKEKEKPIKPAPEIKNPERDKDQEDEADEEEMRKRRKKPLRPEEKFSIFSSDEGFFWNPEKKEFQKPNGEKIIMHGSTFPWVRVDNAGRELVFYRMEEGSLQQGLTIRAEVIDLMQNYPDLYCLIIQDGIKHEKVFWSFIKEALSKKEIEISPSSYFIKQTDDEQEEYNLLIENQDKL